MPIIAQPFHNSDTYTHISEKSHHSSSQAVNLLLCQPCRIFNCLLDILPLQVRVPLQDFLKGGAMRDLSYYDGNGNPHLPNTCTASHDLRIKSNSVKHFSHLLIPLLKFYIVL